MPDTHDSAMQFLAAMDRAGMSARVRGVMAIQRSDEGDPFVRVSIYPEALDLLSRLVAEHADREDAAEAKGQTVELLRALAEGA